MDNISLNYDKVAAIIDNIKEYLQHNNRDLLRYDIDKDLKNIDIAYYENQTEPELDLTFNAERKDIKGNSITTNYDNDSYRLISALTFSMPLGGDIKDEQNLLVAKLRLRKIQLDYDAKLNDLIADVSSLIYLTTLRQRIIKYLSCYFR